MAVKIIYTPFSKAEQGNLVNVLPFSGDKLHGKYRGFKEEDRANPVIADAARAGAERYATSTKLSALIGPDDQLYINAHCNKGSTTMSTTENMGGKAVEAVDVVQQLTANGLPPASRSKLKLWACYSAAAGSQGQDPFVFHLSRELFKAGYLTLRLFAYTESLRQLYEEKDDGKHKRGAIQPKSDEARALRVFVFKQQSNSWEGSEILMARNVVRSLNKDFSRLMDKPAADWTDSDLSEVVAKMTIWMKPIQQLAKGIDNVGMGAGYVTGDRARTYRKEVSIAAQPQWLEH
jgi:hypothetical protein